MAWLARLGRVAVSVVALAFIPNRVEGSRRPLPAEGKDHIVDVNDMIEVAACNAFSALSPSNSMGVNRQSWNLVLAWHGHLAHDWWIFFTGETPVPHLNRIYNLVNHIGKVTEMVERTVCNCSLSIMNWSNSTSLEMMSRGESCIRPSEREITRIAFTNWPVKTAAIALMIILLMSAKWLKSEVEKIHGKTAANRTHHEVGAKVRQTIKELGGAMPENLPATENIKKLKAKQRQQIGGASLPKKKAQS